MFKKILACLVSALIILTPLEVTANELDGKVTSISSGEKAPYAGVLLDPIAASKMIVDQRYIRSEIELQLRKEFQQDLASKRLAFDLIKVEYDSLQKTHKEIILLKDQQINDLNLLLKEEMGNDYTEWWVMSGVVVGIFLSVAAFYASVEVVR